MATTGGKRMAADRVDAAYHEVTLKDLRAQMMGVPLPQARRAVDAHLL